MMNTPTLRRLESGSYQLYWPQSGGFLDVPTISRLADGTHEFIKDGKSFQIDGVPSNWCGKEIEVTVEEVEPA